MLSCRVLGRTEIIAGAGPVELGGPQPRRLITALVAAEGRTVTDDALAEAIWGDDGPDQPGASLQAYVSRLRRVLGREALPRAGNGYRIKVDRIDAADFVAGVERGRELLGGGQAADARRAFEAALALWRGEAYADLEATPRVVAARGRLDELREVAAEERLAAWLATGDAPGAVAELRASVRAQPYRERRWELLILGLYRGGRQTDALGALREIRGLLADELGVDPGPGLQSLERRLLAQDPGLLLGEVEERSLSQEGGRSSTGGGERSPAAARPADMPPARPLSTFLGRESELAVLSGLLSRHRLVTLVGPGGAGKTRLAVEYAAGHAAEGAAGHAAEHSAGHAAGHAAGQVAGHGSWLVRLADVTDPMDVPSAVATAVGVRTSSALATALADRSGLLVLDNCEHLVAAAADLTLELLARCPRLRVLATSREPLGVDGESTLPVAPLPPAAAVALLVDRIGRIRPGWAPDPAEATELRRLAVALDGIPLALELAAARARVLSLRELLALLSRPAAGDLLGRRPVELAERTPLDDRFPALGAVPRGALAPHATLEAAIAWSVDLLGPGDRTLLLRLWPFEGGFPLEAATAVGSGLEALSSLVTRSVVVADTTVTPARYRLLELVRAYCRGRDPDPAASRAAHAAWVRGLVARAERDLRGERSAHTIRTLQRELPNLRAAIAHDLAVAPAAALRMAGQLDWFWFRGGHVEEGQRLVTAALAAAPDAPPVDQARAWAAVGSLRFIGGDLTGARAALETVKRILGTEGEAKPEGHAGREGETGGERRTLLGQVRYYEAIMLTALGEFAAAVPCAEESMALGRAAGQQWIVATAEMSLGGALIGLGDVTRGRAALNAAIDRALRYGHVWAAAMAGLYLARSHLTAADPDPAAALALLRRALDRFRDDDDVGNVLQCLFTGAWALALAGRTTEAAALRRAARRQAVRRGLQPEVTDPARATALDAILATSERPGERADERAAGERADQRTTAERADERAANPAGERAAAAEGDDLDEAAMVAMLAAGHDGLHARR